MRIILFNRLSCEIDGWSSIEELTAALLRGDVVFADGDKITFADETSEENDKREGYAA